MPPSTNWAMNEVHFQYGSLKNPTFAGGGSTNTFTLTWPPVSRLGFLDSFCFVDARAPEVGARDLYV